MGGEISAREEVYKLTIWTGVSACKATLSRRAYPTQSAEQTGMYSVPIQNPEPQLIRLSLQLRGQPSMQPSRPNTPPYTSTSFASFKE
jgi:hypothetical protein